jgi:hypothetical protein
MMVRFLHRFRDTVKIGGMRRDHLDPSVPEDPIYFMRLGRVLDENVAFVPPHECDQYLILFRCRRKIPELLVERFQELRMFFILFSLARIYGIRGTCLLVDVDPHCYDHSILSPSTSKGKQVAERFLSDCLILDTDLCFLWLW